MRSFRIKRTPIDSDKSPTVNPLSQSYAAVSVEQPCHKGLVYDHYNKQGNWCGYIDDADVEKVDLDKTTYLKGPAGSVTVHHCRSVHGSMPNNHPTRARPFLLFAYSAANCLPLMPHNQKSRYDGAIVRGEHPSHPLFEGEPCKLPPTRSKMSRSIFQAQQSR